MVVGLQYALSGWFYTGDSTSGSFYLDLNDIPGDLIVGFGLANGVNAWQFRATTFTATSDTIVLRLVRDSAVLVGEPIYYDDIAITPVAAVP